MKNLLILILFLTKVCFAQNQKSYIGFDSVIHNPEITDLKGSWKISELITDLKTREYTLYPKSSDGFDYGDNITLKEDQTFVSAYSAPCGNDCFTSTIGKYKIIDENYICFFLEKITKSGDCIGTTEPNLDLGLYYYYKTENGLFILSKSSGSLEQDKMNVYYRNLIIAKEIEMKGFGRIGSYSPLFNWKETKAKDEKAIIEFCMNENQIENYEILYSNKERGWITVLLKVNDEFRYLVYSQGYSIVTVGLYDDSEIKKKDILVNKIDNDKKLRSKIFKEPCSIKASSSVKNTIRIYRKESVIKKIIYQKYYADGGSTITTIYLQDEEPIYLINTVYNENIITSKVVFYVFNWKLRKIIKKEIKKNSGEIDFGRIEQNYNQIMENIKNNNVSKK